MLGRQERLPRRERNHWPKRDHRGWSLYRTRGCYRQQRNRQGYFRRTVRQHRTFSSIRGYAGPFGIRVAYASSGSVSVMRAQAGAPGTTSGHVRPIIGVVQYGGAMDLEKSAPESGELIDHRLLAHELEIARRIQQSLLPGTFPSLPGFAISGFCESAHQVGGDFFDV